eukprot:GHVQ01015819.1.p1 GENE.GHVQ01015819.1~~GHVQ01015819.1.p1  ORF type:complete len:397 (-),score=40.21 GHVQ01015819.1:300-1490(-)
MNHNKSSAVKITSESVIANLKSIQADTIRYEQMRVAFAWKMLTNRKMLDAVLNSLKMTRRDVMFFDGDLNTLRPAIRETVEEMLDPEQEEKDYDTLHTRYNGMAIDKIVDPPTVRAKMLELIDCTEIRLQIRDYLRLKAGLMDLIKGRFDDGFFMTIVQVSYKKDFNFDIDGPTFFETDAEYRFNSVVGKQFSLAVESFMSDKQNQNFRLKFDKVGTLGGERSKGNKLGSPSRVYCLFPDASTAGFIKRLQLHVTSAFVKYAYHKRVAKMSGTIEEYEPTIRIVGAGMIPDDSVQVYDTSRYAPMVTVFLKPRGFSSLPPLPATYLHDNTISGWDKMQAERHQNSQFAGFGSQQLASFVMIRWTPGYPYVKPKRKDRTTTIEIGDTGLTLTYAVAA